MERQELRKWTDLLRAAVTGGIRAAEGQPAGRLAAALLEGGGEAAAAADRRPEIAAMMRYAAGLVSTASGRPGAAGDDAAARGDAALHLGATGSAADRPASRGEKAFAQLADWLVDRRAVPSFATSADEPISAAALGAQPETWWYGELVFLHALTSYAILSGDARALAASRRGARFVHAEIQPDHATAMPWAVHAFILAEGCESTAESILNACMIQYGGEPAGAALVLLAEALYCLRHVGREHP